MQTLGIDIARGGWIAVALEDGRFAEAALERMLPALLQRFPSARVVGVDVPIGLPEVGGRRRADVAARALLGARRASVFFAPPAAALERRTYCAARGVEPTTSAQAWALGRAILEVERHRDERVREVHPEVSFAVLAGKPLTYAKKTWNGQRERMRLLRRVGIRIPDRLDAGIVAADDVLDAAVAAWTALRIARGEHVTFPQDPAADEPVIHA